MSGPIKAYYIIPRRRHPAYGLMGEQARIMQRDGIHWMLHREGIVVYVNTTKAEKDLIRIHIAPRNITMECIPGLFAPPRLFTRPAHEGTWEPLDWIRVPKKLKGDPVVACVLYLRRIFYRLQIGHRTGRWRAYDLWPQPGQKGPIWPWEPKRFQQ